MSVRLSVSAVMILWCAAALAQQGGGAAVSQANFNLSGGYAESDHLGVQDVMLDANLPLGSLFGLNGQFQRRWLDASDDAAVDADSTRGQVGLYARDPGRGVLGVEYERERFDFARADDLDARTYRGVLVMYDRAFDLILRRARTRYSIDGPDPDDRDTASAALAGYAGSNARLAAGYGLMATKGDIDVTLAYQPAFAGNKVALELGYQDLDNAGPVYDKGKIYSGRLVYYFGTPMTLMMRHRRALLP